MALFKQTSFAMTKLFAVSHVDLPQNQKSYSDEMHIVEESRNISPICSTRILEDSLGTNRNKGHLVRQVY